MDSCDPVEDVRAAQDQVIGIDARISAISDATLDRRGDFVEALGSFDLAALEWLTVADAGGLETVRIPQYCIHPSESAECAAAILSRDTNPAQEKPVRVKKPRKR